MLVPPPSPLETYTHRTNKTNEGSDKAGHFTEANSTKIEDGRFRNQAACNRRPSIAEIGSDDFQHARGTMLNDGFDGVSHVIPPGIAGGSVVEPDCSNLQHLGYG